MTPPEFLTPEEEKQLDAITELAVDTWQEERQIHEVVKDDESECAS